MIIKGDIMNLNIYPASLKILNKILVRHNIQWCEVLELFENLHRIRFLGKDKYNQMKYTANGTTNAGRYIKVYFVKQDGIKVITARDMSDTEKSIFKKEI